MVDVVLHPGRDRSVRRRHPWLLSGAVARIVGAEEAGAPVRVLSCEGEVLAWGDLSPGSTIRVRLHAFGKEPPPQGWLTLRVREALARRAADPHLTATDAQRLVNAEGDGLPGLLVDRYGDVVVVKLTCAGMWRRRDEIVEALRALTGCGTGYERAEAAALRAEGLPGREGPLWGAAPVGPLPIRERDLRFEVDVVHGQKTGFYLDQRPTRDLLGRLAPGRRVLDLFAYTGGCATAAARAGAATVALVESSQPALDLARRHLERNAPSVPARLHCTDVFRFLREEGERYDLVVADPPPLARRRRDVPRAARAYKDLVLHALHRLAPGGWLLAFRCSHHVDAGLFRKIVFGASLDAARPLRVLGPLAPGSDHPVSLDHPEGDYLSGLWLEA